MFYSWNQQKICSRLTLTLKIPPHLIGVVTLPCKMSDIALKPVTTVTNYCVINVAQAVMWLPNSLNLNPIDYAVWGALL